AFEYGHGPCQSASEPVVVVSQSVGQGGGQQVGFLVKVGVIDEDQPPAQAIKIGNISVQVRHGKDAFGGKVVGAGQGQQRLFQGSRGEMLQAGLGADGYQLLDVFIGIDKHLAGRKDRQE